MKFQKPAVAIADQIALLERRGMCVPDHALARHYLSYISYYRLRAYWLPFECPAPEADDHKFLENTKFDHVLDLYIFDRRLRLLVMDAIERVEVSLRGNWAHHLAVKYGPHGYLDPAIYDRADHYARAFASLIEEIERSKDTFIVHYKNKYDDPRHPPVWMSAEIISLGQLSKWVGNLKLRSDRQSIAKCFGLDEKILISVAHHLTYVRNICAHHGRLWNKQFTVTMTVPNSPGSLKLAMNPFTNRKLYNTLALLGYMLSVVAPGTEWKKDLVRLIGSCPHVDPAVMGFPEGWQDMPAWKAAFEA